MRDTKGATLVAARPISKKKKFQDYYPAIFCIALSFSVILFPRIALFFIAFGGCAFGLLYCVLVSKIHRMEDEETEAALYRRWRGENRALRVPRRANFSRVVSTLFRKETWSPNEKK